MAGYSLQPFDGKTDFSIWQQKMKGILIQQKVFKAIDGRYKLDLSKNIDENLDDFTKLIQDIKLTGDKYIDEYSPIVLLNAIPESYSDVKAAIKYGRDSVNLETVVNGLKSKELDLKVNKPSQNQHEINAVRGRTKFRNVNPRYNSRSRSRNNYSRSKSRSRETSLKNDKIKDRRCYNCGIKGHYIKDCRKPRRENRDRNYDDKDKTNNVTIESNGEVFTVYEVNSVNSFDMNEWLIDSGCTFHMSPFKDIFSNLRYEHVGFVSMANEKKCEIKGLGDISLCFEEGYKMILKNIRYVPDLSHNLISCAALEEEGLEGRWGKGIMKVMKGSLVVFKAERKRNLYICTATYENIAASALENNKTTLWHKRLGHISMKGLDFLRKDGILNDCLGKLEFCDECIMEKHHRVHFPASPSPNPSMSTCILDYVHADVWGPSNVPTHGAVLTAAHLINLSPSVPLSGKTPDLMWNGKLPDLSGLRVFGCSAFVHQNSDKLEPRSLKCIFIGYPEGVKGYRLWVRCQPGFKVLISRDVTFNENEMPCLARTKPIELETTFNKVDLEDNQEGEGLNNNQEQNAENLENIGDTNPPPNPLDNYQLARDRDRRQTRIPSKLRDFHTSLNIELGEPSSVEEAIKSEKMAKCYE
ncbi:UNVERIFIED_CONTAM: Retrovirus-related Pol polyprotein from transposon TNT 1-94 [Sesamum indicum]